MTNKAFTGSVEVHKPAYQHHDGCPPCRCGKVAVAAFFAGGAVVLLSMLVAFLSIY